MADKAPARATGSEIRELIAKSDAHALGALLRLYSFQEHDEREAGYTAHLNDVGFNRLDAGPMSSISQQHLAGRVLTVRQIDFVRRTVSKYIGQLASAGYDPVEITPRPVTPPPAAVMTVDLNGENFIVKFNFARGDARFGEILAKVKTLSGRRFNMDRKHWTVPAAYESANSLAEWGFTFSPAAQAWVDAIKAPAPAAALDLSGLDSRLFQYQKEGVAFVESRNGRALIGDDMGLGKTCQALSWLRLHPERRPAVVVCPASLKLNWAREVRMWISDREPVQIISGKKPNGTYLNPNGIIIINYDILSGWVDKLVEQNVASVIFDESHYTKNSDAQRTKAAKKLAKAAGGVICMSGTPIKSRPAEFFNTLNMIDKRLFPSFWKFAHEFTNARNNGFGWEFKGARNTEKLHKLLTETVMIRRRKQDVLTQLPAKRRNVIPLEPTNMAEYSMAADDIIKWVLDNEGRPKAERAKRAEVLVRFEKLKQLAVEGIIIQAIDWIRDFLDSGEKLVVFAVHKAVLNRLQEAFPGISVRVDGGVNQTARQEAVDRFQEDDTVQLFLGNVQAAGVGITLTAASNTAFVELPWTPGDLVQAEDRVHRIGQEADSVNAWYLLAAGTVMVEIAAVLDEKSEVLAAVLDGRKVDEEDVLTALMNRITKQED